MASNTSPSSHLRPCRPVAAGSKDFFLWYTTPEEVCGVCDVYWGEEKASPGNKALIRTYIVDLIMESHIYSLHNTRMHAHTHAPTFAGMQPGLCVWVVDSSIGLIFDFILS